MDAFDLKKENKKNKNINASLSWCYIQNELESVDLTCTGPV